MTSIPQKPKSGESLAVRHPQLINEWDYKTNYPTTPEDCSPSSHYKAAWICVEDPSHKWETKVYTRSRGAGCPYCKRTKAMVGQTDLATTYPSLINEWDFYNNSINPTSVSASSHRVINWVCREGHTWSSSVYTRVRDSGCKVCSGNRVLQGFNDLATTHPELIPEWSPENSKSISEVRAGQTYKARWICTVDPLHVWDMRIESRTGPRKQACAVCAGRQIVVGVNDLSTTHPHLISEWDYERNTTTPEQVTQGSSRQVSWICSHNPEHNWVSPVSSRGSMGTSCPQCYVQSKVEDQLREALSQAGLYVIGTGPQTLDVVSKTSNRRLTADILLEGHTVIEYDGSYWHRSKQEIDTSKTRNLLEHGYKVVRIRENDLGPLPISHTDLFQLDYQYQKREKVQDFSQLTHKILSILDTLP